MRRQIKFISSQAGSALIVILMVSSLLAVALLVISGYARQMEKNLRMTRVKSALEVSEARLRSLLYNPNMYSCSSTGAGRVCTLKTAVLKSIMERQVPGCEPQFAPCEIVLENPVFNNLQFTGGLIYTGKDFSLNTGRNNITLTVSLSEEIFQKSIILCPTTGTFLNGFNPDGTPKCISISSERSCPSPGSYVTAIRHSDFKVTCGSIGSSSVACPDNQFMTTFGWSGQGNFSPVCKNRDIDPFSTWPQL